MERIDHRETVFLRKVAPVPENFATFSWEAVGPDAILLTGSEYTFFKKGPRKGDRKFYGPKKVAVVTNHELKDEKIRYEKETGLCAECCGNGDIVSGWSISDGMRYRECTKCNGNGMAFG